MAVKNQVQLITYPDSMGGDLKALKNVLSTYFLDTFKGGVHILPPFPSSGDRGFAPLTYLEIEPRLMITGLSSKQKFERILIFMVQN